MQCCWASASCDQWHGMHGQIEMECMAIDVALERYLAVV
jgi:hypothetical protein